MIAPPMTPTDAPADTGTDADAAARGERLALALLDRGLADYRDEGCDLSASCLRCPFPMCMEEAPRRTLEVLQGAIDVGRQLAAGKSPTEAAAALGLGGRTVYRLEAQYPALMAGIARRAR